MTDIYTEIRDEPAAEGGAATKDGMPKPWHVYRNMQTQVCGIAHDPLPGHTHMYGPGTWQQCQTYIRSRCQPTGAVFYC